ncbi:IS630 family transposase [Thiomonas bhubaneswarensis]|uniref:Transposase n=1 Tax=Thiomonas bhubaneswarensis TaxID=339866 RepID=A0A0K6I7Y6_9BURK|nr:IS630 family transposase [Thiomonas bhubaneswarensis]CUA99143.1 Transposase [Thiomonas bhubaneswarensis]CUB00896.1 Transposase [Thiomonas bhubaneswarensis]
MDKEDARYQKLEQLHERRKQVVRLHVRSVPVMQIVALTGLSYPTVRKAIDLFAAGGWAALKPAARGRSAGQGRLLKPEQEAFVRRTICDKRPEQLKMEFALWTRAAVMQFIEREFGVKLSIRATGEYLRRWGLTPQKPIKRAYEQRPEAVRQWLEHEYPAIERRARAEGGEIHWGDETALVNTDVRGRSYAPRGKTPVTLAVGGTRQKLSMISTVTNRGRANWMIIDGAFNHERLIEFFEALVADGRRRGQKVFLILDNLGVHHCKPVKAWLAEHQAAIEVFYLPSYSPELNPDERLNADLKHAIGTKVPVRTKAKLHAAANEHMAFVAAHPERVRSYFQDPFVRYAA